MSPILKLDAIINFSLCSKETQIQFSSLWKQYLIFTIPYAMQFWIGKWENPTWVSEQRNLFVFLLIKFKKKVSEGVVEWIKRIYKFEAEAQAARQTSVGKSSSDFIYFNMVASHPGQISRRALLFSMQEEISSV